MLEQDRDFWDPFQKWGAEAFLATGAFWFLVAVLNVPSLSPSLLLAILLTHLAALTLSVGLVGFYPRLKTDAPRLALAGVICIGFSVVGLLVFPIALIGVALPLGAPVARLPEIGITGGAISLVELVFLVPLSSLFFGSASLRSGAFTDLLGYLLVVMAIPWLTLDLHVFFSTPVPPNWAIWFVVSMFSFAIAYVLQGKPLR